MTAAARPRAEDVRDVVLVDRAFLRRLLAALEHSQTSAGHLAQRVMHEHLGYCSHRSESKLCIDHKILVMDLKSAIDEEVPG